MPWNVGSEKIYQPQIDKQNNERMAVLLVSEPIWTGARKKSTTELQFIILFHNQI